MSTRLTHRQKPDLAAHLPLTAALGTYALTGQAVALRQTNIMSVPTQGSYALTGISATLTEAGVITSTWDVLPAPTFTVGVSAPYNVAATIPNGFTPGGTFSSQGTGGTPLPTGMTFTTAGSLDVGTATVATTTGVKFAYYEPGTLPVLTLNPIATVAGAPYWAGVYPLEGVVPTGSTIVSSDDTNLRASVLNTWPDGSARVVVVAGAKSVTAAVNQNINLRVAVQADTPLTTSTITAAMAAGGVVCDFGGGIQTLSTWTAPDRIWWANSQVICARYRLGLNRGSMEAVVDVHAFVGGRAFVEVMIENSNVNFNASSVPYASIVAQAYTAATVKVNGVTIATVDSSHASFNEFGTALTETTHFACKSWYTSGWVGGDPQIEVTHDTLHMQAHPAFHHFARTTSLNMATFVPNGPGNEIRGVQYQNSVYTPWNTCYQRSNQMGRGSDEGTTIGAVTQWDSFYLMTGSKYPRRASIANALAILGFQLAHRDSATHAVPTHTQAIVGNKQWSSTPATWPYSRTVTPNWDMAHHPATGLVAFMCRPSPVFIELAQRVAIQNATYNAAVSGFGFFYQVRGKAWSTRSLAHAIFLTPDNHVTASTSVADPWKSPAQDSIVTNMNLFNTWLTVQNPLRIMWNYTATQVWDQVEEGPPPGGYQFNMWQMHYMATSVHKMAVMKVAKTANQALVDGVADWMTEFPIRYVNEATGGEWRYHKYYLTIGTNHNSSGTDFPGNPLSLPTWTQNTQYGMIDGPPAEQGTFIDDTLGPPRYSYAQSFTACPTLVQADYTAIFWGSFCMAIERNVPGSDAAWARVNAGITPSLSAFLDGGTTHIKPRDDLYPRNK